MLEFRLLGPMEVRADGRRMDSTLQPRQHLVLAALLADAPRPVRLDTLVDRVWGESPPAGARHALHTHIARIRRVLEPAATPGTLVRMDRRLDGYAVDIQPDQVDLHRFRGLVKRAGDSGLPDADRAALLREALALWRDEPLAGLPGEWPARAREAWLRQRLEAAVQWARVESRLGTSATAVETLAELADEFPLAEPIAAALVAALHAAGRTAEALDRYAQVRRRLVDELGTEPGADLQSVHRAVLRGQPPDQRPPAPPAVPAPAPPAVPAPGAVPAQLPMDVRAFTGRGAELSQLDAVLAEVVPDGADRPRAVVISALLGTAGVGKTALAVRWARRVADRFPDGQLYVNLRGFDPDGSAVSPTEALRGFLDALHVPPQRIPLDLAGRAGLYRSLLAGRRMLVLLDNARDAEQVRPLLPGDPGCVVVVTSRSRLSGLIATEGAHAIVLDLLSPAEARQLLVRRIGAERTAAEPEAVAEIVTACARLPLALAIVAARAATHPGFPLAVLADQLRAARGRLDAFEGEEAAIDVRAVFSWSYRTLSDAAGRLFRLLGLHPGPEVGATAVPSLAGLSTEQVRPMLAELARAHLITERSPGRYACHDLLRAYAAELAGTQDGPDDRRAATDRVLEHYLHTAHAAARLLNPHRDQIALPPPSPGVTPEHIADAEAALNWFIAEHSVLLAAVRLAAETGFDAHTWQLTAALWDFFDRRGHWQDWADTHHAARAAAHRLGDRHGEAVAHRGLGRAYARMGRPDDASDHYQQALALFAELGDLAGEAHARMSLSGVAEQQGEIRAGLHHVERALELFQAAGHRAGQARALNAIGWYHAQTGDPQRALAYCGQALALQSELGDRRGLAATWDSIGYAHQHLGQHDQAVAGYLSSLDLIRQIGDRGLEGEVLIHLGDAYHAMDQHAAADQRWRQALAILDELGDPNAGQVLARLNRRDESHQPRS
ncbi:MAG TPA: BTAD domain-containing putative transcriptional regulator [Pilimelia sp.]|nr:BTAD domain-containing putative transcriptional regulator [Pilimelia sp.]